MKTVNHTEQVTKFLNKAEEDDSDVHFCKTLICRSKRLPAKKKNSLARLKIEEVSCSLDFE